MIVEIIAVTLTDASADNFVGYAAFKVNVTQDSVIQGDHLISVVLDGADDYFTQIKRVLLAVRNLKLKQRQNQLDALVGKKFTVHV